MAGITITDVKVVGLCSKCRKDGDEVMKNKDSSIIPDKELSCPGCALGGHSLTAEQLIENDKKELARLREIKDPCHDMISKIEEIKIRLRIATLITGQDICLDELRNYDKWTCTGDSIYLRNKDYRVFVTVPISTLIDCWIDMEEKCFKEAMK